MESLILFIVENPGSVVNVVALTLAGLLGIALVKVLINQFSDMKIHNNAFAERMDEWRNSVETQIHGHEKLLSETRDDLGKATKAIKGDLLTMSEKIFELKNQLTTEIEKHKAGTGDITRNLILASETSKLAIENLNEKLGRVILIEKANEMVTSQLTKIQEDTGKNRSDLVKHQTWFGDVGRVLKDHKELLAKLQADLRKKDGG